MKLTAAFLDDIRKLIAGARTTVARGVDLVQVHTNFEIGRRIVKQEQRGKDRAAYGEEVIKALAERLTDEFGKGFSDTNLKLMRHFYLQNHYRIGQTATDQFKAPSKSQTVSDQFEIIQLASGKSSARKRIQTPAGISGPVPLRPFTLSWSHYGEPPVRMRERGHRDCHFHKG